MLECVQELLDKRRLDELIYATVSALDERRWDKFRLEFASDAIFVLPDHTSSEDIEGQTIKGVDNFIPIVRSVLNGFDAVQHYVTNMVHTISGDRAVTKCYLYNEQFFGADPKENSISIGGSYDIAAQRQSDDWKLTRMRFIPTWTRGNSTLFVQAAEQLMKDIG